MSEGKVKVFKTSQGLLLQQSTAEVGDRVSGCCVVELWIFKGLRCRVSDLQGSTPSVDGVWSLRAFWEAMAACHFALATMENQRSHSRSYTFRYILILPSPAASCSITSKRKVRNREEDGSQHPKSVLSFGTRTQTPR